LGLTWVQGGESFRRLRGGRQSRLSRSLVILGATFGIYGVLGDYSGIPVVSNVASPASLTIYSMLALLVIGMVIRMMVRSGVIYRGMERRKLLATLVWCFGVVLVVYLSVELVALGVAMLVFAWERWVNQDGSADAPWNYIAGFWYSAPTVVVALFGCILAMRATSTRTRREAGMARSYVASVRNTSSLPARATEEPHDTLPDQ
jgi:hypothetical protein